MELEGKTAVITGGASGIGLATAKRFAASGVNLVLGDIEAEPLARVVKEFEADGAKVVGVLADVTVESDVIALRDAALENFGGAHVVFNNAGVAAGATINTPTSVWKWVLDVDLNGVIYGLNAFVPLFVDKTRVTSSIPPRSRALAVHPSWARTARPSTRSLACPSHCFKSCSRRVRTCTSQCCVRVS